jgi:prepilin-type N-terminal cleavage/methylation domain-containing protein
MKHSHKENRQAGFSLIEMMIVLVILTLVIGVTMSAINDVQKRSRIEEARVDLNQETREFVDQMVRDLHQSGYPTSGMYNATPNPLSKLYAQGITAASQTSVTFEGDVEGDGAVDVVSYQVSTDTTVAPAGQCPCKLQRSQLPKPDMVAPPAPVYSIEVDQVLNSMGTAAGAWPISGTFATTSGTTVVNDTYYGNFKTNPVFRYYDLTGAELVPPIADLTQIKSVKISVSTLSRVPDPVTGAYQAISVSASARIANR